MTKQNLALKAEERVLLGRKVKKLRKQGITPVTVYGHKFDSLSLQINTKELYEAFEQVGESGLVELKVGEKTLPILFKNPQYHPLGGEMIHIDCYKVNLKEKITATVPIEFVGESPAVKAGNVLVEVATEVEVEALPTDLPEKFVVDLAKMETLESVVTIDDLEYDREKIEIKTDPTQVVVKVEEPKVEEEPVAAEEVAPGDVPATEQKEPGEGEAKDEDKNASDKEKKEESEAKS